jgi:GTP cyclohydrolase IA
VEPDLPDEVELAVQKLLAALGVDEGDHTADTPRRVAQAWRDQLWGYREDPSQHLTTTFSAPTDAGLIVQAGIDVQSVCAHHLLPFGGQATVAYRPRQRQPIVGLSKLTRVTYGYSARLQVQERIGWQVVKAIERVLDPKGAIAILTCAHDCMRLRGVRSPASETTTEAVAGDLSDSDVALVRQLHIGSLK